MQPPPSGPRLGKLKLGEQARQRDPPALELERGELVHARQDDGAHFDRQAVDDVCAGETVRGEHGPPP
jgi:hypothetical protein